MPSEGSSTPRSRRSTVPLARAWSGEPPIRPSTASSPLRSFAASSGRNGSKNARSKLSARTVSAIVSAASRAKPTASALSGGTSVSRQGSVPWMRSPPPTVGAACASIRSPVRVQSTSDARRPTSSPPPRRTASVTLPSTAGSVAGPESRRVPSSRPATGTSLASANASRSNPSKRRVMSLESRRSKMPFTAMRRSRASN